MTRSSLASILAAAIALAFSSHGLASTFGQPQRIESSDGFNKGNKYDKRYGKSQGFGKSSSANDRYTNSFKRKAHNPGQNNRIESFKRAKKELRRIYKGSHPALYCGCQFANSRINRHTCGYKPIHHDEKAKRIHWEHVVPASFFGRNFAEWKNGHKSCTYNRGKRRFKGRKCARRASAEFRRMEADMHNLYPAEGELETARKNLQMGIISGEKRRYGTCDVEYTKHTIEPRPAVRGDIARAYLYMADAYPKYMKLSAKQRKMFLNWSQQDPVDKWEKTRNERITRIQGNSNPYITGAKVIATPPVARSKGKR